MSELKPSMENSWVCDIVTDETLAQEMGAPLPSHVRSDEAFCTPHALRAWAQAFLPGRGWSGPLRHVCVRQNGQLQALIPFARQQVARFSINSLAGYYWPFRSLHLAAQLGAGMDLADALGRALASAPPGAVLRFGPISSRDDAMHAVLRQLMAAGWRHRARATGAVFELDLSLGLDTLKQRFSSSLLKHIEYSRRRLAKTKGEVRCERHVLSGDDQPLLDTLAGIESRSWLASKGGDVKFMGPANQSFWTQMGREPDPHARSVCWLLLCGDQPVAFSAHLETDTALYVLANSYDEQWKSHSPGSILTYEVLRDAIARGKRLFDWGQGDSGYKQRWGAEDASLLYDVLMFRPGLLGGLLAWAAGKALRGWDARLDAPR
ncbi:MAG: GNAT family N-acetyltransferase [Proteobacteria bacterium]|nr:GNAT family N-acetyltransferase [Pseudomonadota bacterium]